jgi:3-hydroxybutyryl-CoA dehydratase
MEQFYLQPGETFVFRKTVSESDVYLFAGIVGDLSPNHVDEAAMKKTPYGGRIAHGALLVGYMSACSTMACAKTRDTADETPVSLGYDKVRFLKGVRIGDTVTVTYRVASIDIEKRRSYAQVEITTEDGSLAAVADHILKWVAN